MEKGKFEKEKPGSALAAQPAGEGEWMGQAN